MSNQPGIVKRSRFNGLLQLALSLLIASSCNAAFSATDSIQSAPLVGTKAEKKAEKQRLKLKRQEEKEAWASLAKNNADDRDDDDDDDDDKDDDDDDDYLRGRVTHVESEEHSGANQDSIQERRLETNQTVATGSTGDTIDTKHAKDLEDLVQSNSGSFNLSIETAGTNAVIEEGSRQPRLSSEEYRRMEYGVVGLDALLQLTAPGPVVSNVLPGSPAERAGMQKGDLIVKAKNHVFRQGDGQRVLWHLVAGRAGTPVDITVLRNGQLIQFHLTRMNIEDVSNVIRRRQYESLLSALGPPKYDADGDLAEEHGATH